MMDVMPNIMELTLAFQKKDLDCCVVTPTVEPCIREITRYRNHKARLEKRTFSREFAET